jgi:hypothetical protein
VVKSSAMVIVAQVSKACAWMVSHTGGQHLLDCRWSFSPDFARAQFSAFDVMGPTIMNCTSDQIRAAWERKLAIGLARYVSQRDSSIDHPIREHLSAVWTLTTIHIFIGSLERTRSK